MSGYLPSRAFIESRLAPANHGTPIFAAHGEYDQILPIQLGETARDFALAQGSKVEWHAYAMEHSVCGEEVAALRAWLDERIAALA